MKEEIQNYFRSNYHQFYEKYLPGLKRIGAGEYGAPCVFHADTKPSLNIKNDTGVFFCHGCQAKGSAFQFYARTHGQDEKRDFQKILEAIADDFGIEGDRPLGEPIKTYDYTDETGNILFQVCRFEGKVFRARRPDGNGNGGFKYGTNGVRRVPYRLPELGKAEAETICFSEGEKDSDNLHMLGFTATTTPFGATSYKSDYAEFFRGKHVILFPDNDAPGLAYMEQVAASLDGVAKSVKLIKLPGLEEKEDVSDFLLKFRDPLEAKDKLLELIEQAPSYTPPKRKTIEDIIITIQDFHDLEFPRRAYYLYPWFKEQDIVLITGPRGLGKSFKGHGIANSISKGIPFGPWGCQFSAPILMIDGEMSANDLQERFQMLGLNEEGVSPVYLYSDALANQNGIARAHLVDEGWREKVKSIIMARHIKILILDNLASLAYGLDENVKKDWDPINQWLIDLRFLGVSTIMEHHTGKGGDQRGTSAREDNLDISIMLKRPGDYVPEDGCRFVVSFSKARVSQDALSLIGDTEFKLIQDESGKYVFECKNVRKAVKKDVTRMLGEGAKPGTIMETLGVSKGYVSRIKKEGFKSGYFCKDGKLTENGKKYVQDDASE